MSNSAAEENVNISSDNFLNNLQLDNKSITFEKGKLKWIKSSDSLKNFVETSSQLKGQLGRWMRVENVQFRSTH